MDPARLQVRAEVLGWKPYCRLNKLLYLKDSGPGLFADSLQPVAAIGVQLSSELTVTGLSHADDLVQGSSSARGCTSSSTE